MKFEITAEGYSPGQVDEYLERTREVYEDVIRAQKEAADRLRAERDELAAEAEKFAEERTRLAAAIKKAIEKTDSLNAVLSGKVAREIAALRSFREKWAGYLSGLMSSYPLEGEVAHAAELDGMIEGVFAQIDGPDGGEEFDYNEAVHPTESLSELLEAFGIEGNK